MRKRRVGKVEKKQKNSEQLFHYWVEVRSLRDDTIRKLPLTAVMMVPLASSKINPQPSSRRVLRLQDDSEILEADDFETLRVQLRQRYPDDAFEHTIHWERDLEAEERRERALNGLARLMAEAAVAELVRKDNVSLARVREPVGLAKARTRGANK